MPRRKKQSSEAVVREIRRKTRRKFSSEEKIRIVLEGLRGEESSPSCAVAKASAPNLYYNWSKEFLEAGKKPPDGRHECGKRPARRSTVCEARTRS